MEENQKSGTRIFKKSTPNGKLTIYLGKRDFVDHLSHVDPVEGVVLVDPEYVKDRKVFINLLGAFRYGRDEVDLLGLSYHKDIYLCTKQVYPPSITRPVGNHDSPLETKDNNNGGLSAIEPPTLTRLQERLIRKLGSNAHPFYFQIPAYSAPSVSLNLSPSDSGKPCRVDYELKVYVADEHDDKPQKRNSVRMVIRKLTYAPEEPGPQPSTEVLRDFLMSVGSLRAEVSLDKQKYYHGEMLSINVLVDNNSNKTVKRIKLSVRQYAQICLHSAVNYKTTVAEIQSDEGFPICPSQTGWCKVYRLCPLLTNNRDKIGIAMDGDLKHEDTNLASSTITPPQSDPRVPVGILVQYKVKVRLILGFSISDVCLELPFILTHPNPEDQRQLERDIDLDEVFSLSLPADSATKALPPPSPHNHRPRSNSPFGDSRATTTVDSLDHPTQMNGVINGSATAVQHQSTASSYPSETNNVHGYGNGFIESTTLAITRESRNASNDQLAHEVSAYPFRNSTMFASTGHAITLPLYPTESSTNNIQTVTPINTYPFMLNPSGNHLGIGSVTGGSLTHGPPQPPMRHRFQSIAGSSGVPTISSIYGSFKSERHPSLAGTQSTASEDDLMFEDFARLRLQTVTSPRKTQHSVF